MISNESNEQTLVHSTGTFENLCGILKDQGFRCKYCTDIIPENNKFQTASYEIASPVVCFSDQMLGSITNEYGSYALVMKKSWAKSKGLNPVLYFEEHSLLTGILGELEYLSHAVGSAAEITDAEDSVIYRAKSLEKSMYGFFGYIKSYQNKSKTGKIPENYIFYDEKEWRYVPHYSELKQENKLELLISKERYEQNKEFYNSKAREYKLSFEIEDIAYVVLSHKKEIKDLKKLLSGNSNLTYEQLKRKIRIFDIIKHRRILYKFMKL